MVSGGTDCHSDSEDELPPGWEERSTFDGYVYYVDHSVQHTQWQHPRTGKRKRVPETLPLGWRREVDEEGKVLYVEESTGRTSMADPRLAFTVETADCAANGAHSSPPRQRYDGSTTALQVLHGLNLHDRVAMVTGGNAGIGYEIVRSLCLHACTVILACRDLTSGHAAVERISAERVTCECHVIELDLACLKSVRRCAGEVLSRFSCIDMLILNAGVFSPPYSQSKDGFELQFAVNHLGHYYLTRLLQPALTRPPIGQSRDPEKSRVIVVSSESHRMSTLKADDICLENLSRSKHTYIGLVAYNDSKFCNNVFANELNRRWTTEGVLSLSVHPGNMVSSGLSRHWWLYRWLFAIVRPFTKSLQQAAATPIFAATAPELSQLGGAYLNNCWLCEQSESACDVAVGARLWSLSERAIIHTLGDDAFTTPKSCAVHSDLDVKV